MTYEQLLEQLIAQDERIMVLTAENRAAIRNLPPKIGHNFVDVGIAEQTMIGMAAGLALRGRLPITHALATFLTLRAYEFIRTDVGISGAPVTLVGGVAGFLSEANGPTHQAIEDISILRSIPGMQIFCPADEADLLQMMPVILASGKPAYIRYVNFPAQVQHEEFTIGKAELLRSGSDVTIMSYGFLLRETLAAADILAQEGISTTILHYRTVVPFDAQAMLQAASTTKLLVTVEDHFRVGGLYSLTAEALAENKTTANILPIALHQKWFKPTLLKYLLEHEGFSAKAIADSIRNTLSTL